MDLPEQYLRRMKDLLGEEYPDYLASLEKPADKSLRVNTLKWTTEEARERLPFLTDPVPWVREGSYYREGERPSLHPAWSAGLYYIQEASAMAPGALLPVREGARSLDLCAAPGGKATQAAARLGGSGVLYANDISVSRAQGLLRNLEMAGVGNMFVTAETPERLAEAFPEYFDGILVDAPCSGEGMFRRDSRMTGDWLERGPAYYAPRQAQILDEAVRLVRPGGSLLYSTCTFSREEDEENVEALLGRHPEMRLQPLPLLPGFSEGFLPGTVRLWPHRVRGEGHFLALLEKRGERSELPPLRRGPERKRDKRPEKSRLSSDKAKENSLPAAVRLWKGDALYALPAGESIRPHLRYVRTGLKLGERKGRRFVPSQALAMNLRAEMVPNRVCLPWEDGNVLRYLKGETLSLPGDSYTGEEGWCLVCLGAYPLGWGIRQGDRLKNKYCPGWRRQ